MKEQVREITGKDGQKYTMKSINAANAEQFLDFMYQVSDDTHFMTRYGDEVGHGEKEIKEEEKRLQSLYDDSRQTMTSIFDNEKIVGNIAVRCIGKGRKTKHRCEIGLGVRKEYHGAGLGTILMEHAIDFAKNAGYTCMELEVLEDNTKALGLYKKMGFVESGKLPCGFKLDDGTSIGEISMYKLL